MIPGDLLRRDAYIAADDEMARARCAILSAFTSGFAGLLTALWWWSTDVLGMSLDGRILADTLSATPTAVYSGAIHMTSIWPTQIGWVVLIQNALIFVR